MMKKAKSNIKKRSNIDNNATSNIKNNYTKTPNELLTMDKNILSHLSFRIYVFMLSLDAKNTYLTYGLLKEVFKIKSKDTIRKAIRQLEDLNLVKITPIDKSKQLYHYELLNLRAKCKSQADAGEQEQEQESQADAGEKEQKQESQADAGEQEQEIIEDLDELTEDEKKVHKFNDLYKQYCTSCTKIIKDVKESKIIYIMDKYNEIDIIKTLKEFNKFIEVNEGKYKDNYKYLITNFGRLFKKETNKFNNFTQRNYTKSDFKKLEKSFFNNNSDVGADAEKKNQESQADAEQDQEHKNNNRKKEDKIYKITEEDKKYTKAYVMQKELVSHLIEIYANIFEIHKPTTQAEYMKALEIECNKYIPKNNKIHDFQERDYTAKEVLEMEQNFYI